MRRQRAEWMKPADDRILETLEGQGAGTPKSLADELEMNNDYVGSRCRTLVAYGLVDRVSRGLYKITDDGRAYLLGNLDASELERDD